MGSISKKVTDDSVVIVSQATGVGNPDARHCYPPVDLLDEMKVGDTAIIKGLKAKPEFNGKQCTILKTSVRSATDSKDVPGTRCAVKVESGEYIRLKPSNLTPSMPSGSSIEPVMNSMPVPTPAPTLAEMSVPKSTPAAQMPTLMPTPPPMAAPSLLDAARPLFGVPHSCTLGSLQPAAANASPANKGSYTATTRAATTAEKVALLPAAAKLSEVSWTACSHATYVALVTVATLAGAAVGMAERRIAARVA